MGYVSHTICHFVRECPHKKHNKTQSSDDRQSNPARAFVVAMDNNIIECQASDTSSAGMSINYMILDTGCPQNVAGFVWIQCFR